MFTTANLFATIFGVEQEMNFLNFKKILEMQNFQFERSWVTYQDEETLIQELKFMDLPEMEIRATPLSLDLDMDTNLHTDWLTATTNLRTKNFQISNSTRLSCKMFGVRPSVITVASTLSGLAQIEFYKILLEKEIDAFHLSNLNLATSFIQHYEPSTPKKRKTEYDPMEMRMVNAVPEGFTCWDKIIIEGDLTLQALIDVFPQIHFGCKLTCLFFFQELIWISDPFIPHHKRLNENNLTCNISEIFGSLFPKVHLKEKRYLNIGATAELNGDIVHIPEISIKFF
eukprot:TRINITY_DN4876_c0_g2_i1.p1 TRINITY_DN4876_c0_g2~~TRINITY_DN4876_c0_g2_i1.p1  ORF type:complete len:285 (-),score=53.26 TRINITY_DN4876_c0_g2_i1:122-976(-)